MKDIYEQLILHEGLTTKPYVDTVGKITIGVGHNLSDNGITKRQAMQWLEEDVALATWELKRSCRWVKDLSPMRERVLIDMAFNLGIHRLLKFVDTLGAVRASRYPKAAKTMLASRWAKQVGNRARRLAFMMEHDRVPTDFELSNYVAGETLTNIPAGASKEQVNG